MVNATIDRIPVSVPEGTSILEAARAAGEMIPSLCYLKEPRRSFPPATARFRRGW